ncbi:hypothetical protein R3P38DRAFT_2888274 [Favolaschia claudopus]|uniref:DUF6699 domain-containing protein n=1 Tax=Favolaschia claudopus TaxID=2862362 RepID=A0AAW0CRZ6_9AGAR
MYWPWNIPCLRSSRKTAYLHSPTLQIGAHPHRSQQPGVKYVPWNESAKGDRLRRKFNPALSSEDSSEEQFIVANTDLDKKLSRRLPVTRRARVLKVRVGSDDAGSRNRRRGRSPSPASYDVAAEPARRSATPFPRRRRRLSPSAANDDRVVHLPADDTPAPVSEFADDTPEAVAEPVQSVRTPRGRRRRRLSPDPATDAALQVAVVAEPMQPERRSPTPPPSPADNPILTPLVTPRRRIKTKHSHPRIKLSAPANSLVPVQAIPWALYCLPCLNPELFHARPPPLCWDISQFPSTARHLTFTGHPKPAKVEPRFEEPATYPPTHLLIISFPPTSPLLPWASLWGPIVARGLGNTPVTVDLALTAIYTYFNTPLTRVDRGVVSDHTWGVISATFRRRLGHSPNLRAVDERRGALRVDVLDRYTKFCGLQPLGQHFYQLMLSL